MLAPEPRLADIRVLIADDEKAVRDALAALVDASSGMTIVAVAEDAPQAIDLASQTRPDVALLDVRMPGGGPAAVRGIREASPNSRVLALSASGGRDTVLDMLRAGAAGYLVKGVMPAEVISGIRSAALGQAPMSAEAAGSVMDRIRAQLENEEKDQRRRAMLVDQLGSALDGDGLEIVYQPIFDLGANRMVGVEALARFAMAPKRPPNEWFDAAHEVGLGQQLELAAVTKALTALERLPPDQFITVNLSPTVVQSTGAATVIPSAAATRIVVEITEHERILDYESLGTALAPMRSAGVGIAVDDAGSGFTSLRNLLELAPQYIKLDIGITQRIDHDRAASAMAAALTAFADGIEATVVAEGIETPAHVAAARKLGIRYGQGYLLGRPAPISDF